MLNVSALEIQTLVDKIRGEWYTQRAIVPNDSDKAMRVIAGSGSLGASSGVIGSLAV